jgi:hypothetical protein
MLEACKMDLIRNIKEYTGKSTHFLFIFSIRSLALASPGYQQNTRFLMAVYQTYWYFSFLLRIVFVEITQNNFLDNITFMMT